MNPRLRLGVLGIVVVSLFAVMFARLWYLQVLAAPDYEQASTVNRIRFVTEPAPRGRILDRQGRVLVDNRVSDVVTVSRAELKGRDDVIARLSALLGQPVDVLAKRIDDPRYSPYKPVPIAQDVPKEVIVYIREHADQFPGVEGIRAAERFYPQGGVAAHLLGYVGEINDRELAERKSKGYRLGDSIGKSGIERIYEDDLRGEPGLEKLEVDARGKVLRSLGYRPPEQGRDVQLTIDLDVQRLAEDSLAQGLDVARHSYDRASGKDFVAPAGAAVVMDPRDGSVLALASNPSYDPASFLNGIKPDVFKSLQDPANHFPLNDRTIQGQYAPGSTFKLVTAVASLEKGLITPATTFLDTGKLKVGNRTFRNAGGRSYGRVNVTRAITVSSDVFFYTLGANFWTHRSQVGDAIQDTARSFGLGDHTGIPLSPEARGRVPDPETRKRLHDANPKGFPEGRWFAGDNVNLAIGQGETTVTPLQLANAYATFANGGTLYQPRVAAAVRDRAGKLVRQLDPIVNKKVNLPPQVHDPILAGLAGAVNDPKGTAHGAFAGFPFDKLSVAGKTGTAQVRGKQDTALFVAIAPVEAPQYVLSVVMEESGFGGSSAAPVARRILTALAGTPPGPINLAGGVD